MSRLIWEPHPSQAAWWPRAGRHVLAQFDDQSVVVYQAYSAAIAAAAVHDQRFGGGGWSKERMSWIKPNFLWMMFRSGWARKEGQERVLAIWIPKSGFDEILARAVHSSFVAEVYPSRERWEAELRSSEARLQWDPDHHPGGAPLERRAVQLGLRGALLARFAGEWILCVEDITEQVHAEHQRVQSLGVDALTTPRERVYFPRDRAVARRLGLKRVYGYVGPEEIRRASMDAVPGERIASARDLEAWSRTHQSEREAADLWATFVVDGGGNLRLASRRSEHVACAGGDVVLAAGELSIRDGAIVEISNQSTGYCPDLASWHDLEAALDRAKIAHPSGFTFEAIFRRCPKCAERNLVKDGWFACAICGGELPAEWNF